MIHRNIEIRRGSFFVFISIFLIACLLIYMDIQRGPEIGNDSQTQEGIVEKIEKRNNKKYILTKKIFIDCGNLDVDCEVGDRVRVRGQMQESLFLDNRGYGLYLRSRGYSYLMKAKEIEKGENRVSRGKNIFLIREKIKQRIDDLYGYHKKMVRALILGDRELLSQEDRQMFSKAGISHIISISGFHIILIGLIFYQGVFFLGMKERYIFSAGMTFLYVLLTGANPPCVRAYIFYITYIISIFLCKRYDIFSIGFLLAAVYMVVNPYILFNAGFCLSFLAVFSIGMFYPILYTHMKKNIHIEALEPILSLVSITISAQILTFPYVVYNFGIISIMTIFTNLISVPIVSIVYPFMLFSIICCKESFLSEVLVNIVNSLFDVFYFFNQWLLSLPYSYVEIENKSLYVCLLYYMGVLFLYHIYMQRKLDENGIESIEDKK